MSFQAMTWAVEQKLPSQQKIVLLMLANRTNHDTGRCDPSHKRLADDCGMSTDSVKRAIKSLEESGHLAVVSRSMDGVRLPNQYRLNLQGVGADSTEGLVHTARGVGADSTIKQESKQEDKTREASPTGSRLPADWSLPSDWKQWAVSERPDVDPIREASTFADYWTSVAGSKGRKADWQATWRNWIRRANSTAGYRGTSGNQGNRRKEL